MSSLHHHLLLLIAVVASGRAITSAFSPSSIRKNNVIIKQSQYRNGRQQPIIIPTTLRLSEENPAEWPEDRRSAMFQTLLRDLQIEGVPLLGCDANQVHTLNAALWTTMAELGDQDDAQRACLILEEIPTSALLLPIEPMARAEVCPCRVCEIRNARFALFTSARLAAR